MFKKKKVISSADSKEFFQQFYEENKAFLFHIASQYAASIAERDDLMQEALVRLLRKAGVLREMGRTETASYIALTVKTVFLDMERRKCKERLVELDSETVEALLGRYSLEEPDLFANLEVEKIKKGLSQRDWLALEGKYILGYSHRELSELLGVDGGTVRSLVSRARKKAKRILARCEEEE